MPAPFKGGGWCDLLHRSGDALATDMDAGGGEFGVNPRCSISAAASVMDAADTGLEGSIVLLAGREHTVSPGVVPARGDAEETGRLGDGEAGLIRSHELERSAGTEPVSRANEAVALPGCQWRG